MTINIEMGKFDYFDDILNNNLEANICLMIFSLISQVLVNLLISMMAKTYEGIEKASELQYKYLFSKIVFQFGDDFWIPPLNIIKFLIQLCNPDHKKFRDDIVLTVEDMIKHNDKTTFKALDDKENPNSKRERKAYIVHTEGDTEGKKGGNDDSSIEELIEEELAFINNCIDQNICTYSYTKDKKYVYQKWYQCITCGLEGNKGCCEVCKNNCHKDHELVKDENDNSIPKENFGPFYCDCPGSHTLLDGSKRPHDCEFFNVEEKKK